MMSKPNELENTIKNIVQEIMRESTHKGIHIASDFVVYYVKLLILDPSWGISPDSLPVRIDVQNFVKHCVQVFENQLCPSIITLKMQLYFTSNLDNLDNMVVKNRMDLKARLEPLEKEILETQTNGKEDMEKLYKKIIYLITLSAGLGNPTTKSVYNEAEAALKSIFLENDLNEFMAQSHMNKEMQIVELTELVTGIRLFNRDNQKGGAGIEDLPRLLSQAIDATHKEIQRTLVTIMENVYMFTTALDNCFTTRQNEFSTFVLNEELPEGVLHEDVEHAKNLLIAYRQYELYVRKTLLELGRIEKVAREKYGIFNEAIERLNETVRFRIAIPTIQVFPLFCDVAQSWCQLQDQTIALSQLNQILFNLQMYMKELSMDDHIIKLMLGPNGTITDAQRLAKTIDVTIASTGIDATVLDLGDIKDFDKLFLQYLGFCAWKFVETGGVLIPANPNMGVVQVHELFYIFSTPEAAAGFGKNPSRFIMRALDLARKNPELINLLELKEQLVAVREIEKLVVELPTVTVTYESGVQTDLHPVQTKIDPNYTWNLWDWKRQAIMLANISRCKTHSTQTVKSQAWNAVKTQTRHAKHFGYQTKKDNYSNVPTLSNFIYGLRGRKDSIQHIITLTRPVDE